MTSRPKFSFRSRDGVRVAVEVPEHRGVLRHRLAAASAKLPVACCAEQHVLLPQQVRHAHLRHARCEVVVPEPDQPLLDEPWARLHLLEPPRDRLRDRARRRARCRSRTEERSRRSAAAERSGRARGRSRRRRPEGSRRGRAAAPIESRRNTWATGPCCFPVARFPVALTAHRADGLTVTEPCDGTVIPAPKSRVEEGEFSR